ncbi:MAG: hypothetical protein MUE99_07530 [Chitinophagaceae bacterium]|nr:hypothetical protein [Chitinophagaceae bacterium]
MKLPILHNRDLSWLAFNHRVLEEAADPKVPLLERIKFLSIFSSNLDEFYRVRFPAILALHKMNQDNEGVFSRITSYILEQQKRFGAILDGNLIPELKKHHVHFINAEPVPGFLESKVREIFFNHVAGLLQTVFLEEDNFFPVNNRLYMLVVIEKSAGEDRMAVVNIPSSSIPRFYTVNHQKNTYILFLDDIIKCNLSELFPGEKILNCCNFKITRDADLNLNDDFEEDIALKIEKKLQKRDFGLATRFLYQPGISGNHLEKVMELFHLHKGSTVSGGVHHSFKDLFHFPVQRAEWQYPPQQTIELKLKHARLLEVLIERDKMVHTPYHSYNPVLRFFNELAITKEVETIFTTFYRIASDSRIAQALITAARNGKKVFVLVELKARFDEENNLRWSKRMKEAGIKIIYSDQQIKVHAKIALAILNNRSKPYVGLLATGNLNENTAKVYTDHILMTSHNGML